MTLTRSGGTGPGQSLSGKVYPIAPFLRLCLACRGKKLPDVHTDRSGYIILFKSIFSDLFDILLKAFASMFMKDIGT